MNNISFNIAVVVMALAVVVGGCSQPAPEPDPQAALAAYFDSLINGNYEEAAKYISSQASGQAAGRAAVKPKERETFEAMMVRKVLASHVSYEIAILEKTAAGARAAARIKSPDFPRIARDIIARLAGAKFPPGAIESLDYTTEIVNSLILVYRGKGVPMTVTSRNYTLVREAGGWKISGWQ